MLHLVLNDLAPSTPHLPRRPRGPLAQLAVSAALHLTLVATVSLITITPASRVDVEELREEAAEPQKPDVRQIVFLAPEVTRGGGGGGGGNRQQGPIRRAEGVGADRITLRVRKPEPSPLVAVTETTPLPPVVEDVPPVPALVLDAKPLVSGTFDQPGLPSVAPLVGTSTGSGTGGGVGTGSGTGIGAGHGPGLGPGSGGGTGGGPYRAGGSVSPPRVVAQVRPAYTSEALLRRIEGSVTLEAIVLADGTASHIRVVRSLDRGGLDDEAVIAVAKWRFEPGRLDGVAVDVFVRIILDFSIR